MKGKFKANLMDNIIPLIVPQTRFSSVLCLVKIIDFVFLINIEYSWFYCTYNNDPKIKINSIKLKLWLSWKPVKSWRRPTAETALTIMQRSMSFQ